MSRRGIGLRARTAAAFGLTAVVLAVTLAGLAYGIVRRSLPDQRESAAMRQGYTNARLVRSGLRGSNVDLPRLLSGLQVGPGGYTLVQYRQRWFASSVDLQREGGTPPEGAPVDVPRGDGSVSSSPVSRDDYRNLLE